MNIYFIKCFIGLVLLLPWASAAGQTQAMLLKNANIIDVHSGKISEAMQIMIEDGKIKAIDKDFGKGFKGKTLDVGGKYILPGLINTHIHLGNEPDESWEHRHEVLEYLLNHGITTVRDAAGDARILQRLQQDIQNGKINGPDIYYAAFVAGPSYYEGNDREKNMVKGLDTLFAPWLQCIRPGADLDKAMSAAKACGATGIKIYGGFDRAHLIPLVEAGKKAGLEIWGHATLYPAKPLDAAEAGMKVLSHVYLLEWEGVKEVLSENIFENYERFYDKIERNNLDLSAFIKSMKKKNAIFDPTLYLCLQNGMDWTTEVMKQLYQAGVRICAGTDWMEDTKRPYPFLFDEIKLYVEKCGFSPCDAIRSATIIAAETVGKEKELGSIEVGKQADLLIVEQNPLENIDHLQHIALVMKQGKIVKKNNQE